MTAIWWIGVSGGRRRDAGHRGGSGPMRCTPATFPLSSALAAPDQGRWAQLQGRPRYAPVVGERWGGWIKARQGHGGICVAHASLWPAVAALCLWDGPQRSGAISGGWLG